MRCNFFSVGNCKVRKSSTFTMIELLVVIGIIGTLAAILMPALMSAKGKAREISCLSNLKQIALANSLYESTYKRFVPFRNGTHPTGGAAWDSGQWWFGYRNDNTQKWDVSKGLLVNYLDNKGKTITCPQAKLLPIDGATSMNGGVGGYGYNANGVGSTAYLDGYRASDQTSCWDNGGMPSSQIASPSKTVMFADAANLKWGTTSTLEEKAELTIPYSLYDVATDKLKCKKPAGSQMYGTMHFRHLDYTANVVWVDGHATPERMTFNWAWGGAQDSNREKMGLGMFGPQDNSMMDPWNNNVPDTLP